MGVLEFILYMFIVLVLGTVLNSLIGALCGLEKKIKKEYENCKDIKEEK